MARPFQQARTSRHPLGASTQARGAHLEQGDEVGGGSEGVGDRAAGGHLERGDDVSAHLGDEDVAGERTGAVELGELGERGVVVPGG